MRPKHSFGQNFLSDASAAEKIAQLVCEGEPDTVLELGAGLGALTFCLLHRHCQVVAVERDRDLVPALESLFAEAIGGGRLRVLEADAKSVDWGIWLEGQRPVIAGNLPYQITGPLLHRTVTMADSILRAVFLVQKEVADRLTAEPGTKQYGALSVFTQACFDVRRAFLVKSGAFYPAPRVDSAVVVLEPLTPPIARETATFRSLVKAAFHARRKTLRNAWKGLAPPELLQWAAAESSIELDARGETLSVQQFAAMSYRLEEETE